MLFEIVIYDIDTEKVYARMATFCSSYDEMMRIASQRCQEIMEKYKLDDVCWNYTEVM